MLLYVLISRGWPGGSHEVSVDLNMLFNAVLIMVFFIHETIASSYVETIGDSPDGLVHKGRVMLAVSLLLGAIAAVFHPALSASAIAVVLGASAYGLTKFVLYESEARSVSPEDRASSTNHVGPNKKCTRVPSAMRA